MKKKEKEKEKEKENHPFTGIWNIAAHDTREFGKWERDFEVDPDEWVIAFFPDGRYGEIYRPEGDTTLCRCTFDETTGIISIFPLPPDTIVSKCIFADEGDGTYYLYYYEDSRHIPQDAAVILEHHAWSRYKLTKIQEL